MPARKRSRWKRWQRSSRYSAQLRAFGPGPLRLQVTRFTICASELVMNSLVREPAVAGQFYPGRPDRLRREVEQYTAYAGPKVRAIGCVAPHAGYMYSGHVAGAVYARLELPQRFVILCPNHTGMGQPLAMMSSGAWAT